MDIFCLIYSYKFGGAFNISAFIPVSVLYLDEKEIRIYQT